MNTVVINNFSRDPNYHLPLPEYHCHVSAIKPGDQFERVVNISHDQVGNSNVGNTPPTTPFLHQNKTKQETKQKSPLLIVA